MSESNQDWRGEVVWGERSSWWLEQVPLRKPGGEIVHKGIVRHPGAVVLVPLVPTAVGYDIIMLRQYRLALNTTILELPAGTRGWEEEWLSCAQRELREETGYRAATFDDLGHLWPTPGSSTEVMRLYLAQDLEPDPLPQDFDEDIEVTRFPLEELHAMALDGRLQDAKSVIGILRAQHLLRR